MSCPLPLGRKMIFTKKKTKNNLLKGCFLNFNLLNQRTNYSKCKGIVWVALNILICTSLLSDLSVELFIVLNSVLTTLETF